MRINKSERVTTFLLFFVSCLIYIILILALLKWPPALSILDWSSSKGFLFSIILLIILFVLSFSMSFFYLLFREKTTISLGNTSGLGEISISLNGIKNAIRDIATYFSEIQEIRPEIENIRGKIMLTLRIKVPYGTDITRVVNELQHRVKVYFENVLSLNLENINIIIEDVVPAKKGK